MDNTDNTHSASASRDGLQPVEEAHRPMTQGSYALVFWSSGIIVQIMVIGLYLLHPVGALNFIQVIVAGVVASVLVALLMMLQGHFGLGNVWVYFFFLLILQSLLAYRGVGTITRFNGAMSLIIFAMLLYFFYVVFAKGDIDFSVASEVPGSWGYCGSPV